MTYLGDGQVKKVAGRGRGRPRLHPKADEKIEVRGRGRPRLHPAKVQAVPLLKVVGEPAQVELLKKVLVPMPDHLTEAVEKLTKLINRNGLPKKKRITVNSVIRASIKLVCSMDLDVSNINDDESLEKAILKSRIRGYGVKNG